MRRAEVKASIGLGLGLPTEVLHTSFVGVPKSVVGLGIYVDFDEEWNGLLVNPYSPPPTITTTTDDDGGYDVYDDLDSDDSPLSLPPSLLSFMSEGQKEKEESDFDSYYGGRCPDSSPPMLGTRRPRLAAPKDSFWSEYASLRTPLQTVSCSSASLRSSSSEPNLYLPNDGNELELEQPVDMPIQMGFLGGHREIISVIHEHELPTPLNFDEVEDESGNDHRSFFLNYRGPPPSPSLLPQLTQRYLSYMHVVQPKPRKALMGLEFDLTSFRWDANEEEEKRGGTYDNIKIDVALEVEESSASSTSPASVVEAQPSLGFDSPSFWEAYSAILYGDV